ncbi:hypothetical protein [Streptomyces sp. NBC_00455]|uniref:hypothetical protein n=1 Tax=Streptomyces sp. NBC_00455 TaxID=2903654 RepID=UPI002E1C1BFD
MSAHSNARAREPEGTGLQSRAYGVPSAALLARADRGFARFLAQTRDHEGQADGSQDIRR